MIEAVRVGGEPNLKIDSMFAFVARAENGDEGVMGASMIIDGRPMMVPLVGADMKRVMSLYPVAKDIEERTGIPFRIYRFDNKIDITEEVVL